MKYTNLLFKYINSLHWEKCTIPTQANACNKVLLSGVRCKERPSVLCLPSAYCAM